MNRGLPSQTEIVGPDPPAQLIVEFSKLYREEFAYVWRTLRRLGVLERDLPDVTHDLFVVVFRQLTSYDRTRPLRPWLFGIAFRVVSDYRRSARFAREVLDPLPELVDPASPADDRIAFSQAQALVLQMLERLDLDRRAVFVMHDLEGQPMSEIASALAIPLPTAYSRLRLAREDVAAAIKRLRAREEVRRS